MTVPVRVSRSGDSVAAPTVMELEPKTPAAGWRNCGGRRSLSGITSTGIHGPSAVRSTLMGSPARASSASVTRIPGRRGDFSGARELAWPRTRNSIPAERQKRRLKVSGSRLRRQPSPRSRRALVPGLPAPAGWPQPARETVAVERIRHRLQHQFRRPNRPAKTGAAQDEVFDRRVFR